MVTIEPNELKRAGWRSRSRDRWEYEHKRRHFRLTMHLRQRRVDSIEVETKSHQRETVFDGRRGFLRHDAKHVLHGRDLQDVEKIMEALEGGFYITL